MLFCNNTCYLLCFSLLYFILLCTLYHTTLPVIICSIYIFNCIHMDEEKCLEDERIQHVIVRQCNVMSCNVCRYVCTCMHVFTSDPIALNPWIFDPVSIWSKETQHATRTTLPTIFRKLSFLAFMIENGTISISNISNYSDTLKQQVVSEEECAPRKTTFTLRVGWNITMRGWCWAASSCHVLRHQIGSWIILLSISSLQRGKPRGHEGPVGGLRKVSIYGVTDGCLWGFRMWRVDSIHWSPCDFWMKVRDSLCQRGCLCKALRLKLEDVYCGNNVRIDLYSMIMNLVGWN